MSRTARLLVLIVALAGCGEEGVDGQVTAVRPDPRSEEVLPSREVLRISPNGTGSLDVRAVVATAGARAILLAEIGRRWPGRALRHDIVVEAGAPAGWVSEAVALMPYAAELDAGGMVVRAEPGRAGGGEITLTGRVPDEPALARLAADAAASVAPPFVVRTSIDIGMLRDTSSVADTTTVGPVVVVASPGAEAMAGALRAALAGAALGFQPGTTTLDPASELVLDRLASFLLATPGTRAQIACPGEGSGSVSLERALARRRTGAFVDALVHRGVDPAQVAALEGDELPAAVTVHVFVTD